MAHRTDLARGRDIVARWCDLAERRLAHLTELFESGRWRRYHSERSLLENIQEAKAAVETWRGLLSREASLDNAAIDLSWLGRARTTLPQDDRWRQRPAPQKQFPVIPAAPAKAVPAAVGEVMVAAENILAGPAAAPAVSAVAASGEVDLPTLELPPLDLPTLDLAVMQQRYPLLRNAL